MSLVVLSQEQAKRLLAGQHSAETGVAISPDLGLTQTTAHLSVERVSLSDGAWLSWEQVGVIADSPSGCYRVEAGGMTRIQAFSEATGRAFSLYPTSGAPTMLLSGIPMHRIKDIDPYQDTLEKIKALKPITGRVLDTTTGLGYTAIQAAKTASQVITIELDEAALEIARSNPWSQELFNNPKVIQRLGDSFEVVDEFEEHTFQCVIHDPPAFSLAGDLYSGEFYRKLCRVMRHGGKMFHYIGDPESKSGRSITAGVIRRLQESGFRRVMRAARAFGVVAYK